MNNKEIFVFGILFVAAAFLAVSVGVSEIMKAQKESFVSLNWSQITEATNYCLDKDTGLVAITIDTQVKAHCLDGSVLKLAD